MLPFVSHPFDRVKTNLVSEAFSLPHTHTHLHRAAAESQSLKTASSVLRQTAAVQRDLWPVTGTPEVQQGQSSQKAFTLFQVEYITFVTRASASPQMSLFK